MDDEQKPQISTGPQQIESTLQQPAEPQPAKKIPIGGSRWQRFRNWYGSRKKWAIPATVLLVLLILAAVPWSRYKAAGLVVKKDFTIEILDSTSRSPVSGATVSAGSISSQTDGNGRAALRLSAGHHSILISKKYYEAERASVLVPILSQKSTPAIEVDATGRQVKIIVKNLISQKILGDVDIKVADITAKTDKNGEAIVVLPVGTPEQKATLGLAGYNNLEVTVKISSSEVLVNNFALTPAGKIYFISKRTGKLDLMKANLDGSEAKVVVAATGKERDYDTVLLPSPDWKYVALLARRTTTYPTPQLYILSTEDDELLGVDNSDADFSLAGWSGNNLIYTVIRSDLPEWRTGRDKLKSYNASTGKITLLNQNSAVGDSITSAYEYYTFVVISGENIIYAKNWTLVYDDESGYPESLVGGKKHTLSAISAAGQGYKQIASYELNQELQYSRHSPTSFFIWQRFDEEKFYDYAIGAAAPKSVSIDSDEFYDAYKTFYVSPSGKKALWAEARDGKFTIFVGDTNGLNAKTVASLEQYDAYGWFNDDYILVAKDGSELHIMSAEGSKPVKITDFQPTAYTGY
ncbi:hypothetical protein HYS85_00995 [Candidatus Saccharibacteria bacterium]|nr:hypothetical protein [Candidatus Saccharibacteria bacterium]